MRAACAWLTANGFSHSTCFPAAEVQQRVVAVAAVRCADVHHVNRVVVRHRLVGRVAVWDAVGVGERVRGVCGARRDRDHLRVGYAREREGEVVGDPAGGGDPPPHGARRVDRFEGSHSLPRLPWPP